MATVPIQSLTPDSAPPANASIRGIVTLSWPYSASTKQCAFLLADLDFRLRNHKGQVRVRLHGPSAEAVAKAHVGIGDEVVLQLQGASWAQDVGSTRTPGRSVDGELSFGRRLGLTIVRAEGDAAVSVDAPTPPRSPLRTAEHPAATPLPRAVRDLSSSFGGAAHSVAIYSSPAFTQRLRLSGNSFLDSAYDPFQDVDVEDEQPNKKLRLSFGGVGQWRYAARTPSPVKETYISDSDHEAEQHSPTRGKVTEAGRHDENAKEAADVEATRNGVVMTAPGPDASSLESAIGHEADDMDVDDHTTTNSAPAVPNVPSSLSAGTMLPPPLPRLQMPDAPSSPEVQDSQGEEIEHDDEPSTPEVHAVPNSALPPPSPFPSEPAQPPFASFGSTPGLHASDANSNTVSSQTREIGTSGVIKETLPVSYNQRDAKVGQVSPRKEPTCGIEVDQSDLHTQHEIRSHDVPTTDENLAEDANECHASEDDENVAQPFRDEVASNEAQHTSAFGYVIEHEAAEPARAVSVDPADPEQEDSRPESEVFQSRPQTPAKQSATAFGFDGASSPVLAVSRPTPPSERETVMARTYRSLFGFTTSPAPQSQPVAQQRVQTPTPTTRGEDATDSDLVAINALPTEVKSPTPLVREDEGSHDGKEPEDARLQHTPSKIVTPDLNDATERTHREASTPDMEPEPEPQPVTQELDLPSSRHEVPGAEVPSGHNISSSPPYASASHSDFEMQEDLVDAETASTVLQNLSTNATLDVGAEPTHSSAAAVIEIGSSSDLDMDEAAGEEELLSDAQNAGTVVKADADLYDARVEVEETEDDGVSTPHASAQPKQDNAALYPPSTTDDMQTEDDLSSPLATSQLEELVGTPTDHGAPADESHFPRPLSSAADKTATRFESESTPTAPADVRVSSSDAVERPTPPHRSLVQFPAERVIEDSQDDEISGTLSTQPTPTAEEFDVFPVPRREPARQATLGIVEQPDSGITAVDREGDDCSPSTSAQKPSMLELQNPPPSTARKEVIELGSSSPVEESFGPAVRPKSPTPLQEVVPATTVNDSARLADGTAFEDFVDSDMLASPVQTQPIASAPSEDEDLSQVTDVSIDDEHATVIGHDAPFSQGSQSPAHLTAAEIVTYPSLPLSPLQPQPQREESFEVAQSSLPLSPLQSQPQREESFEIAQSSLPQTAASAMPPIPQLTQHESDLQVASTALYQDSAMAEPQTSIPVGTTIPDVPQEESQPAGDHTEPAMQPPPSEERPDTATAAVPGLADIAQPQDEDLAEVSRSPPSGRERLRSAPKNKPAMRSLKARLSDVPDVISAWFSPNRPSGATSEAPVKQPMQHRSVPSERNGVLHAPTNGDTTVTVRHPEIQKTVSNGFSTILGYFTPLSRLEEKLNFSSQDALGNTVGVLAVVTDKTKTPERAKAGPRDYYTVFRVADASLSTDADTRVEVFRPWKAVLPIADVGDVVLLRSFAVKSRKRQAYLLSTEASAWCVWRYPDAKQTVENLDRPVWARKHIDGKPDRIREEIKGPPVEHGEEERRHAGVLRDWWVAAHGRSQTSKLVDEHEGSASNEAVPQAVAKL